MRIHHLNCISMCPVGGALMDGRSPSLWGKLVCHCLLIETDAGLVLVDTGMGLQDVARPRERISEFFLAQLQPDLREEMTAVRQVRGLGYAPEDVRHILLTHLDFDHAGGLDDFPQATVHLMAQEEAVAAAQRTWLDRQRFRPQQWSTRGAWQTYPADGGGEPWFGFPSVRGLRGLPPEILFVPLPGHTLGHTGIAVQGPRGWLLHTGDAYFFHAEMDPRRPRCTPGLAMYQRMMEQDRRLRLANQQRLRELRRQHSAEVQVFCAHDLVEFRRLAHGSG